MKKLALHWQIMIGMLLGLLFGFLMTGWDYGKQALTFTVQLNGNHGKRAYQRFLPEGPIALLPTYSDHHSIVVWSTTPDNVQKWKNISAV